MLNLTLIITIFVIDVYHKLIDETQVLIFIFNILTNNQFRF